MSKNLLGLTIRQRSFFQAAHQVMTRAKRRQPRMREAPTGTPTHSCMHRHRLVRGGAVVMGWLRVGVLLRLCADRPTRSLRLYVGKGVGDRVYGHVWSAMGAAEFVKDGIESESFTVKSAKNQRIRDIYQSGRIVETSSLGTGSSPRRQLTRAHAIEQTLIDGLRLTEAPTDEAVLVTIAGGHTTTERGPRYRS